MAGSRGISPQPPIRRNTRSKSGKHNTVKKSSQKREHSGSKIVLSVFLGLLTVVFLCSFIVLTVIRTADIPRIAEGVITEFNIGTIVERIDDNHYLLDQINLLPIHDTTITYNCINTFFKFENVTAEVADVMAKYVRALASGDLDYHITVDDVVYHSLNVEPELRWLFARQLTYEDYEFLAMMLDDILDFDSLNISGLAEDFEFDITVPRILMSVILYCCVAFISAGLLAAIIYLGRKNLPGAFLIAGSAIALAGLIAFTAGLWLDASLVTLGETVNLLFLCLENPASLSQQYGFMFAAAGILIITISISLLRAAIRIAANQKKFRSQ